MLSADLTHYANGSVPSQWDAISRFRGVAEGDMIRYAIAKPEPLRSELEAFVAAVVSGEPGLTVSLGDGLEALLVAERITDAASASGVG
jgi:predicted dehydrogenase